MKHRQNNKSVNYREDYMMKRRFAILITFVLVLSMLAGNTAFAATSSSKLTTREKAMLKAYIKVAESLSTKDISKYMYPDEYFYTDNWDTGNSIKIISPKYSKKYDKEKKMYCLYVSGIIVESNENEMRVVMGMRKIKMGLYIKKKGKTEYIFEEAIPAKDDNLLTVENLSKSQVRVLQSYLNDTYGEAEAHKLMYPEDDTESTEE
jgi:hypothetical protein